MLANLDHKRARRIYIVKQCARHSALDTKRITHKIIDIKRYDLSSLVKETFGPRALHIFFNILILDFLLVFYSALSRMSHQITTEVTNTIHWL